jgi:hypothetical protein
MLFLANSDEYCIILSGTQFCLVPPIAVSQCRCLVIKDVGILQNLIFLDWRTKKKIQDQVITVGREN